MTVNREKVRTPTSAELSAASLIHRIVRRAHKAVLACVERTWPNTTAYEIRGAILQTIDMRATLTALIRIGLLIQRGVYRDLSVLIPGLYKWDKQQEETLAVTWAVDVYTALEASLVSIGFDDARLDGTPSLLNSTMGRLRALRATNAQIIEVLDVLRDIDPEERAVISQVRSRVFRWEARSNQRHQEKSGIKRYIWRTKGDGRVRPGHARLDGTTQRWAKPPDVGNGRHLHPGEDYHCRCVAEPILTQKTRAKAVAYERARA